MGAWSNAAFARDSALVASFMAEDGKFVAYPPLEPIVTTRAEYKAVWDRYFAIAPTWRVQWTSNSSKVFNKNEGFTAGTYQDQFELNGELITSTGKTITTWKRSKPDCVWYAVQD